MKTRSPIYKDNALMSTLLLSGLILCAGVPLFKGGENAAQLALQRATTSVVHSAITSKPAAMRVTTQLPAIIVTGTRVRRSV